MSDEDVVQKTQTLCLHMRFLYNMAMGKDYKSAWSKRTSCYNMNIGLEA